MDETRAIFFLLLQFGAPLAAASAPLGPGQFVGDGLVFLVRLLPDCASEPLSERRSRDISIKATPSLHCGQSEFGVLLFLAVIKMLLQL